MESPATVNALRTSSAARGSPLARSRWTSVIIPLTVDLFAPNSCWTRATAYRVRGATRTFVTAGAARLKMLAVSSFVTAANMPTDVPEARRPVSLPAATIVLVVG